MIKDAIEVNECKSKAYAEDKEESQNGIDVLLHGEILQCWGLGSNGAVMERVP